MLETKILNCLFENTDDLNSLNIEKTHHHLMEIIKIHEKNLINKINQIKLTKKHELETWNQTTEYNKINEGYIKALKDVEEIIKKHN